MKHTISHTALLVGAVFALSAGAAQAQFVNDGTYIDNPTGVTGIANPVAIPVTPGTGTLATNGAWVLEGINTGPVVTSVANAVGANGQPAVTYQSEASASTYVPLATAAAAQTLAGTGGTWAAGDYLVNTSTGQLFTGNAAAALLNAANLSWVSPTAVDPTVHWQQVTYNLETAHATAVTNSTVPAIGLNNYLIDKNGNLVSVSAATTAGLGLLSTPSQIAAAGFTVVSQTAPDPKATSASVPSTEYAYTGVAGASVKNGANTIVGTAGGGVLTNATTGQSLAAGPGGAIASDPNAKQSATFSAGGLSVYDGNAGHSTQVGAGLVTLTNGSNPNAKITLDATVDPVLTVTNGTAAGTTTINNGTVTAGTSVNAPVVNAGVTNTAVANVGVANIGQANVGGLAVAPNSTVDMGGNRVQDVGAPVNPLDATNKAYVDKGLNKAYEGTAIALSLSQPIFTGNQTFAIRAGWGEYESQNAFGLSAAGIIGRDWLWSGSTVALDGGVGFGSSNTVAGKAGVTFGFGGGAPAYIPMK